MTIEQLRALHKDYLLMIGSFQHLGSKERQQLTHEQRVKYDVIGGMLSDMRRALNNLEF
jgi:hypothetical protein